MTKVTIDRELLERVAKADASNGASPVDLVDWWKAMEQIRSILAAQPNPDADNSGNPNLQDGLEVVASQFPEINFANYGQDEVEALQAWGFTALDAMADAQRVIAELREECEHLKACQENAMLHMTGLVAERDTMRQQHDKLAGLLAKAQEELDSHRHAVLWGEICAALAEVEKAR